MSGPNLFESCWSSAQFTKEKKYNHCRYELSSDSYRPKLPEFYLRHFEGPQRDP